MGLRATTTFSSRGHHQGDCPLIDRQALDAEGGTHTLSAHEMQPRNVVITVIQPSHGQDTAGNRGDHLMPAALGCHRNATGKMLGGLSLNPLDSLSPKDSVNPTDLVLPD